MWDLSTAHIVAILIIAGLLLVAAGVLIGRRTEKDNRGRSAVIKRTRQIGTFKAHDSKGKLIILSIYQEFLDAGVRDNPEAERKGRRQIMTSDGRHVDKVATRKYRAVGSPDILTSDDPNAL